ncbi:carbohydrate ABC transporter permease [Clostridium diolis]|uniref:carbohydrate ABC transporter permease n=1 Tax=Clostridium diolis TaxID=223919 RepID=UPI003AF8B21D
MKAISNEFKYSKSERIWRTIFTIMLAAYCCITVYMIVLIISNSFKTREDLIVNTFGFAKTFSLESYKYVLQDGYVRSFLNSILITGASVLGTIVLGVTAAYGITRYKFKYSEAILSYFLIGMMLPIQLKLIPLYSLLKSLHLMNTFLGVIIINISNLSLPIFILATFFKTLPHELYEAGKVDGASEFKIFYHLMVPLAKPIIAAVSLLTTFTVWNDFFLPLVILSGKAKYTLPLMINNYTSALLQNWSYLFAAVALSIIPIILIFVLFSKQIIEGIASGGVKG